MHDLSFHSTRIFQNLSNRCVAVSRNSSQHVHNVAVSRNSFHHAWQWMMLAAVCCCCRLLLLTDGHSHLEDSLLFLAWTTGKSFPHQRCPCHQTQRWWAPRWSPYGNYFPVKQRLSACVGLRSRPESWAQNLWPGTLQPFNQTRHRSRYRCSPDSVSNSSEKVEWRSGRPRRLRQDMRWRSDCGASALWSTRDTHADLIHQALSQCGAQREKCACVLRPVRCSVFTPSRARHSLMSAGEVFFFLEKNTNVQDFRKEVRTQSDCIHHFSHHCWSCHSSFCHARLCWGFSQCCEFHHVVDDGDGCLCSTDMTPLLASVSDFENEVANEWVSVESFLVEGRRRSLVLDEPSLHVVSLHLWNLHESTCCPGMSDSFISMWNDFCIEVVFLELSSAVRYRDLLWGSPRTYSIQETIHGMCWVYR